MRRLRALGVRDVSGRQRNVPELPAGGAHRRGRKPADGELPGGVRSGPGAIWPATPGRVTPDRGAAGPGPYAGGPNPDAGTNASALQHEHRAGHRFGRDPRAGRARLSDLAARGARAARPQALALRPPPGDPGARFQLRLLRVRRRRSARSLTSRSSAWVRGRSSRCSFRST